MSRAIMAMVGLGILVAAPTSKAGIVILNGRQAGLVVQNGLILEDRQIGIVILNGRKRPAHVIVQEGIVIIDGKKTSAHAFLGRFAAAVGKFARRNAAALRAVGLQGKIAGVGRQAAKTMVKLRSVRKLTSGQARQLAALVKQANALARRVAKPTGRRPVKTGKSRTSRPRPKTGRASKARKSGKARAQRSRRKK